MAAPVCLIDASIYIFKYYFAMPENWHHLETGYSTETVYGYTGFLLNFLTHHKPTYMAACFDESLESGFRHVLYPEYKSSRALPDPALAFQLQKCKEVTQLLGIQTFASDVYEADDLLGSLYHTCLSEASAIAILTRDKDLGQVLSRPEDYIWDYSANIQLHTDDIARKFGVRPKQMVDFLALVGDVSDDIPGVPGIGAKTACGLLAHFQSIAAMFERFDEIEHLPLRGAKTLANKIRPYITQISIAQQLATIVLDIPVIMKVTDIKHKAIATDALLQFAEAMGWPKVFSKKIIALSER